MTFRIPIAAAISDEIGERYEPPASGERATRQIATPRQPPTERDRASALRASEEARAARFRELAAESAQTRRCIHCGASAPAHLEEGECPPCGCP